MTARVVHVSDLHTGSHGAQEPYTASQELAERSQPDLVLATGDVTERGRSGELERARRRLHRRGEAQGINVYESDAQTLTAATLAWDGSSFAEIGRRTFPRG